MTLSEKIKDILKNMKKASKAQASGAKKSSKKASGKKGKF